MKQTLQTIIASLVDNPDSVSIKEETEDSTVHFLITVAKDDMGKIIGKSGKVIRAIRNIMKIPAIKQGKRIDISLEELA